MQPWAKGALGSGHCTGAITWASALLAATWVLSPCRAVEAGVGEGVVVRVGDHSVAVAEFDDLASRLSGEMALPWGDLDAVRQRVLAVLLAREVLLLEGEARALPRSAALASALKRREGDLVADRMYGLEVLQRAQPSQAQLDSLYEVYGAGEAVRARHILCATEEEAQAVLVELAGGADFAQLAQARSRHSASASTGGDMGYMRREQLLPEMQEAVWQAPAGQVLPAPIRTPMGYHVIQVTDHRRRTAAEMRAELEGEVARALRRQREEEVGARLRERYRFRWDGDVAAALVAGRLTAADAPDTAIAAWDGGALTVGQFIQYSRKQGRRETEVDTALARQLGEAASLRGLLGSAGREARVSETDPETARALRLARAELVGEALHEEVAGKVDLSAAALRRAYESDRGDYRRPPTLRVQEILVDDPDLADSLAALVRGGADMADLATRFTRRVWAAPKGGDIGEITEGMAAYAKMARAAREAPVGQLVGPIPSHGGYSILRVTSRREDEEATFEEARVAVAESLRDRAMDAFIDSLRVVYADRIQVDEKALAQTLGEWAR